MVSLFVCFLSLKTLNILVKKVESNYFWKMHKFKWKTDYIEFKIRTDSICVLIYISLIIFFRSSVFYKSKYLLSFTITCYRNFLSSKNNNSISYFMSDIEYANEIFHEKISNIFLNFFKEMYISI